MTVIATKLVMRRTRYHHRIRAGKQFKPLCMLGQYMSSVNDSPNRFIVLDAVSRGMKSMGTITKVMKVDGVEGGKNACLATLRNHCREPPKGEKQ